MRSLLPIFGEPYPVKMTSAELGKLLVSRRKKLGLARRYVAELAGISSRQLLEWEAGRGNPSFAQLQSVLTTLGLSLTIDVISLP